jgi:hypothetical protein
VPERRTGGGTVGRRSANTAISADTGTADCSFSVPKAQRIAVVVGVDVRRTRLENQARDRLDAGLELTALKRCRRGVLVGGVDLRRVAAGPAP